MAKTCDNLPINTVGPFEQTLFLGCSIQSISSSLGWNEQQSTLTVTLVEDTCPSLPDKPKVYYPKPGLKYSWHDADPGFTSPTIGAPVYFRIGSDPAWPVEENDLAQGEGFEIAGIIQSWTKDYSPNGNPTYSVQIVDPRLLLQNLEIIISDYAGGVYGGSGPGIYNLINAYGWLEYTTKKNTDNEGCPQKQVKGANFGSPAGGFGNSMNNNNGTPWHELRSAMQYLLSGATDQRINSNVEENKFSPFGYAKFRGARPQSINNGGDFVDTNASSNPKDRHGYQGFGIIGKNEHGGYDDVNWSLLNDDDGNGTNRNAHGLPYIADYIIDIREIPFTPRWYRLAGPSMNMLDMISQICSEAGSDYYVELIITKSGKKIIKVRSVKRAVQPQVGGIYGIEQFITDTDNVTSKNISRELRNEPTSVFIYGGYVQTVYQQTNQLGVQQYWGKDAEGVHQRNCRIGACTFGGMPSYDTRENGDWAVELDVRPLNLNLSTPLPANKYWMSETELRMALGDFDAWYNYVLIYDNFVGTPIGQAIRATHSAQQNMHFPSGLLTAGMSQEALANLWENLMVGGFTIQFAAQDPTSTDDTDLKKIYGFIQNWADTFYGKQFLVQLPFVCYTTEPDSMQVMFSDTPTNDGGYPAEGTTTVLDLAWQDGATPEPLDFFADESHKLLPFARYHKDHTGAFPREGDYIVANNSMYVKGSVEEKPIAYTSPFGTFATALFKVDNAIEVSGSNIKNMDTNFEGMIRIAMGAQWPTAAMLDKVEFGIQFQPDGGGRADVGSFSCAPRRRQPNQVAVPMKSNTTRYGPLSWAGPPGPVTFLDSDGLVPWEYGGYGSASPIDKMWGAMTEQARDALSFMQVGERGSINFPGYPVRRLGAELRSAEGMMDTLMVENEDFSLLQGGAQTFTLKLIKTVGWNSAFGPNITNISINIGTDGFTTNYTLSTFSPSFGRFAKYNANKLKQTGKQRTLLMRMQRDQNKLRRSLVAAQGRSAAQMKNLKGRSPTKQAGDGSSSVVAGTNTAIDSDGAGGQYSAPNSASMTPRTLMFGNPKVWPNQAFMSQDGLTRPISNDGSNTNLPRYTQKATGTNPKDTCLQIPHTRRESNPPYNGAKSYTRAIIDIDYLDPWAGPSKAKHDANSSSATNYADIGILSHGATAVVAANMYEYVAEGNSYPSSVRGIAHKGPFLLHGWGYDIDGKPIPNEADSESSASGGDFVDANLKDRFLSHYLRKPHTWPVGPVDLRWDRKRAVWTVPSEFKIIKATAAQEILPGATRTDCTTTRAGVGAQMGTSSNPVYDGEGNLIGTTGNIQVSNPDFNGAIGSGTSFYAIYDSIACTYYPIMGGGGGATASDSGYCDYTGNYDSGDYGPKYGSCSDWSCLAFGQGLQIAEGSVTGEEAVINAAHYISSTGTTLDDTESYDKVFFDHLSFGSGMGVKKITQEAGESKDFCKYEIWSSGAGGGVTDLLNFRIQSGCDGPYISRITGVTLGCGLSGEPFKFETGSDGLVTGVGAMQLHLNPLACPGGVTDVRYVDDICCSGAGFEIIYKHLRFTECGLFTGTTGDEECSSA